MLWLESSTSVRRLAAGTGERSGEAGDFSLSA